MERITKLKVKNPDGSFTESVPIGARSVDVLMNDGSTLEQILGGIILDEEGSLKEQFQSILNKIGSEEDYQELGETLAEALQALKLDIENKNQQIHTRVTNIKEVTDNKIESGDNDLREYINLLSLNADNKVNLLTSTLENRLNNLSNTMQTRVSGLELNSDELNREYSNLTSELKFAEQVLLTKVDGARVDDQGFLYLLSGEQTIVGPLGPFNGTGGGSGGGGGSSASNNAVITLTNTSGWIAKSISSGNECNITCTWSSIEDETPTGEGVVTVYINGISRQTLGVDQGSFTIKVGTLLTAGRNSVRVSVADVYGNTRSINYTVTVINATISSSFNTSLPYSDDILFSYVPLGDLNKTVYFILDGNQIGTQQVTTSGRQITYTIPAQTYGTHSLEVYFIGDMDGVDIQSNHLYFEFAVIDAEHSKPIITSNFNTNETEQYNTLAIPYRVYSPTSLTSQVTLKVNGVTLTTIYVDRSEQVWSYRCDNEGQLILRIECGEQFREFNVTVTKSSANIYAETQNLALYLTSANRNNGELNPANWSYNDINATFTNFNFVTDGWQLDNQNNTVLRLAGDARLTIPYKLFGTDFKNTGKTIEIEFATKQVADYSTNILSCFADNRGLLITPQQITFKGAQTQISTLYKENEHIRLSIVIEKQTDHRLILIYINGIMSRAIQYASGEQFTQLSPVNITIGSNDCDIDIYNIRVYDNNLNRTQVLGNWIADTQNSELKIARYNRNNVYDEYGEISNSKIKALPYMIIEGSELPQYKGDKKTIRGTYIDPVDGSNSFTFENCQINVQGTSSSVYFRKNWDLQFKDGFTTANGVIQKYALRKGSIPFNRFVLKADVASSESTNNTGLTMFYNDTCPYKTPEMIENPKIRWGIEGIPIVLYWHNTTTDKIEFLGKHNFNLPKRAPDPYGYANDDTLESWEVERNNSDNVKFKDNDFETLSWDEVQQKYFPEWYNDFEARFPSDEWRDISKLNELVTWIKSTYRDAATGENLSQPVTYTLNNTATVANYQSDHSYTITEVTSGGIRTGYNFTFTKDTPAYRLTKFKAELPDYFEMESAIFYYLFTQMFTMIDSRAKNMFIGFNGGPVTQPNRMMDRKATCQPYDMDTAIGTNNSGILKFGFYHEDGDHVSNIISGGDQSASEAPVFNAQDSVLWSNVRDSCRSELVTMYRELRATGVWSYEVVQSMYENHQSKWCEAIFNEDAYIKYLYPLIEAVEINADTNQPIRTDRYLTMLQGSKAQQRKWWLYNRFRYMDSKFSTGNASSATLDIRLFNSGTLNITPVNDIYVGVAYGLSSTPEVKRALGGETISFVYNAPSGVTDMETSILSGDMITDLGDLSVFYPNEINFAKGTRLKHLKIGNSASNYSNTHLEVLNATNSPLLEDIDCRNCPALASTINLENSPRLKQAYFDGTSITGIDLAEGGVIEVLHLPATITTLTLINLNKLQDLTIAGYSNISRLMLTNISQDLVDPIDILRAIQPNSLVNIQGLNIELQDAEEIQEFFDLLDTMQGVSREKNANGEWLYYEYDTAQIASYNTRYPYIEVTADHTTSYITYMNYSGTQILYRESIIDGANGTHINNYVRSSTAQYSYTPNGWSLEVNGDRNNNALNNVIADRIVYAAYISNIRSYTVNFYNGETLLYTTTVPYGSNASYVGITPTSDQGEFMGWNPPFNNITENRNCYAIFNIVMTEPDLKYLNYTIDETNHTITINGLNITQIGNDNLSVITIPDTIQGYHVILN